MTKAQVTLTEDELIMIRELIGNERARLKNTDYDAEIIVDAEIKAENADNIFFKMLKGLNFIYSSNEHQ